LQYQTDAHPLFLPLNNPIQKKLLYAFYQLQIDNLYIDASTEMIKTVARINPSTGRLIFAKLVTADPILTNGSMEIILKESTLYLVLYRFLKQRPLCIIEYFFHVANFVIIPCWLQNKKSYGLKLIILVFNKKLILPCSIPC
jgi:hypothetical protein